jgi:hypothetical protein
MTALPHPGHSSDGSRTRHAEAQAPAATTGAPACTALGFTALLEGLDGVAYVTDADARVVAVGQRGWNSFATLNNGEHLLDGRGVIGTSLFDFISGKSVSDRYRAWFDAVSRGSCNRIRVGIRCDGPGIRRELSVTMTALRAERCLPHVLFQAQTISAEQRPEIALFDYPAMRRDEEGRELPILTMCSFCHDVRYPPVAGGTDEQAGAGTGRGAGTGIGPGGDDRAFVGYGTAEEWLRPEDYYRRGGAARVRISHGMCPACFADPGHALTA